MITVEQLMTTDVRACSPDDPLAVAARIMWEQDCGCVPVINFNRLVVGMVTDRDICMSGLFRAAAPGATPVREAMSTQVWSVAPGEPAEHARRLMEEHQVRRLPVVDLDGELVGLISLSDLAQTLGHPGVESLGERRLARTLAAVSRPRFHAPNRVVNCHFKMTVPSAQKTRTFETHRATRRAPRA